MISWHVISLQILPGYRLDVTFADGLQGVVDMSKDGFNGVFKLLADEACFAQATIRDGAVAWPNGMDIAPDAMYEEISGKRVGIDK